MIRAWVRRWLGIDEDQTAPAEVFVVCDGGEPKCACTSNEGVRDAVKSFGIRVARVQVFRVPMR